MATLNWRETLAEMIAEPTISSDDPGLDQGNRRAVEALANRLDAAGFACDIRPFSEREDKVNLVARLGPKPTETATGLVFSGHIDTVPYDDKGWDSDPFTLTERDHRLYGLGTTDMKGFVALAAGVAAEYAGQQLAAPLSLVVTADEECGMDGARILAQEGINAGRYCVIGEPTGLVPIRRHKGIFMETIETLGATGHSSNPAHGANAIEAMHHAIGAVRALRDELAGRAPDEDFPVPHATLNLGTVRGGDAANRIPPHCRLDIDLRFLPGDSIETLRGELRERVQQALADSDCEVRFSPLFTGTPALETPANSPVVTACEALTGQKAAAVDFGTEGAFYNAAGMESVILGPGDISLAHQPNEYLALNRIAPMQTILHGLVSQFCRGS